MSPLDQGNIAAPEFGKSGPGGKTATLPPVLQQAPKAPRLETYEVSFWVQVNKGASVTVNYRSGHGLPSGAPFMRFDVPQNSISSLNKVRLVGNDSIQITATIDTVDFRVHFEPAGLTFSSTKPPTLTLWWENANLDLNGNGVVDGWDWKHLQGLAFWYQATSTTGYKLKSHNDVSQEYVSASLYHFSEYALAW